MDKVGKRGQSLVEFSLVLPAMFFMVLLMLELFFIVRTKIVLGFAGDRIARAAAAQGSPMAVEAQLYAKHFTVGPLWGIPQPAQVSQESLPQWPAYSGFPIVSALDHGGRLAVVDLSFVLFRLPNLGAHVELPVEEEVPDL